MIEFRWANEAGAHGMPTPEQCEANVWACHKRRMVVAGAVVQA